MKKKTRATLALLSVAIIISVVAVSTTAFAASQNGTARVRASIPKAVNISLNPTLPAELNLPVVVGGEGAASGNLTVTVKSNDTWGLKFTAEELKDAALNPAVGTSIDYTWDNLSDANPVSAQIDVNTAADNVIYAVGSQAKTASTDVVFNYYLTTGWDTEAKDYTADHVYILETL